MAVSMHGLADGLAFAKLQCDAVTYALNGLVELTHFVLDLHYIVVSKGLRLTAYPSKKAHDLLRIDLASSLDG